MVQEELRVDGQKDSHCALHKFTDQKRTSAEEQGCQKSGQKARQNSSNHSDRNWESHFSTTNV